MSNKLSSPTRRGLLAGSVTIAIAQLARIGSADAQPGKTKRADLPKIRPGANTSFAPLKQIEAGVLNVGYAEAGLAGGPVVILLHGWPYDIYSYVDVAPLLASAGYRAIVSYLRGYRTTNFLSSATLRNSSDLSSGPQLAQLVKAVTIRPRPR